MSSYHSVKIIRSSRILPWPTTMLCMPSWKTSWRRPRAGDKGGALFTLTSGQYKRTAPHGGCKSRRELAPPPFHIRYCVMQWAVMQKAHHSFLWHSVTHPCVMCFGIRPRLGLVVLDSEL